MNCYPANRSTASEARTMQSDRVSRSPRAMTQRSQGGQVIVIFGLALVAIVAMVALIVEGGNAFAQQRVDAERRRRGGERRRGRPRPDARIARDKVRCGRATRRWTASRGQNNLDLVDRLLHERRRRLLDPGGGVVATKLRGGRRRRRRSRLARRASGSAARGLRNLVCKGDRDHSMSASADATAVAGRLTAGHSCP